MIKIRILTYYYELDMTLAETSKIEILIFSKLRLFIFFKELNK